jgi:hypothetical protein
LLRNTLTSGWMTIIREGSPKTTWPRPDDHTKPIYIPYCYESKADKDALGTRRNLTSFSSPKLELHELTTLRSA